MTRRKRVKNKWHFTIGDFELKKASYNFDGSKSFEVCYKNSLVGYCDVSYNWRLPSDGIRSLEVYSGLPRNNHEIVGKVYCTKSSKTGFPTKIVKIEISPDRLNMVYDRKVLLEKTEPIKFISPGVSTREND
jgi:hypothetical protein